MSGVCAALYKGQAPGCPTSLCSSLWLLRALGGPSPFLTLHGSHPTQVLQGLFLITCQYPSRLPQDASGVLSGLCSTPGLLQGNLSQAHSSLNSLFLSSQQSKLSPPSQDLCKAFSLPGMPFPELWAHLTPSCTSLSSVTRLCLLCPVPAQHLHTEDSKGAKASALFLRTLDPDGARLHGTSSGTSR